MATKKELIAELVLLGADEAEIKNLKNPELEELLDKAKEASVSDDVPKIDSELTDNVEPEAPTAVAAEEKAPEAPEVSTDGKEVVRETSHQLGIFSDYIYNVKNKGADVIVENLGFGDIYINTEGVAKVGYGHTRILLGEQVKLEGIERVYVTSASQPVVQILEIK